MSSFVMDTYPDSAHFRQQQQQQQQQQWPHLISTQPPFPSPPPSEHGQHYPQQQHYFQERDSASTNPALSLNLSSLTVTSPTNISPINQTTSAVSPATPISPSSFNPQQSPFQFDPHHETQSFDEQHHHHPLAPPPATASSAPAYDRRPGVSRSSSSTSSSSQLPSRKRSFTSNAAMDQSMFDESRDTAMDLASSAGGYEDLDMRNAYGSSTNGGTSPIDGSGSNSGAEDALGGPGSALSIAIGGSINVLGKPMATNNFVTKLYQMINDRKSAHFIAWTELGTSFVVSNVGEFSRSILGSHFKHNNFSSFVRQLNMYGFHKINRTPRAQRTSTDAQTWEFSHHKFLRGRPDLLDEIKRKALEPDPAIKHRVELPGEVAAQLSAMRDENRRMADQLNTERKRVDNLVNVVGRLWDVMNKSFPGSVGQFPQDLSEAESPNIYITSPTATTSRYPPPLSMNIGNPSIHGMHSHSMNSPSSSPTTADFPNHPHHPHHPQQHHPHQQQQQLHPHPHSLSRQQSFQHLSYSRGDSSSSTPLPPSPGSGSMELMDEFEHGNRGSKRPRLSSDVNGAGSGGGAGDSIHLMSTMSSPGSSTGPGGLSTLSSLTQSQKKGLSRARSDSAPLGYSNIGGNGALGPSAAWQANGGHNGLSGPGGMAGRPRSGSGLGLGMGPRIPNINNMTRSGGGTPLLSIATVGDGMTR